MGDYESTMTGFMDHVTDDMSLAREERMVRTGG